MSLKSLSGLKIGDYTLPTSDGTNGQVLQTDGSGNITFQSVSTTDKFLDGLSFNTSTGVLTASVSSGSDVTVDLDGRYVPLGGGSGSGNAMTGDLHIKTGAPKIYLQDTTDDDDQAIIFRNNGGTDEYKIATSDFTSGGGADGFYIGSTTSDGEIGLVTANTTALTLDTSQNAIFAGNLRTPASGKIFLWTGHDSNFLQYNLWQASASGGMTIKNIASGGNIIFQTVSTTALTIDSSQNATFAGDVNVPEYIYHASDTTNYHRFLSNRQIFVVGNASSIDLNNGVSTFGSTSGATTVQGSYVAFNVGTSEKMRLTSNQLILEGSSSTEGAEIKMGISTSGQTFHLDNNSGNFRIHTLASGKYMQIVGADGTNTKLYGDKIEANNVFVSNDLYVSNEIYHSGDTNTYIQFPAADQFRINTGGGNRLQVQNDKILVGDGVNMQYDGISTSNSGTVVRGGFLNPASEANMVHIPHIINDLAGFNKWSNATITTSGFYGTRSGSSGSYTYSNEITNTNSGWANAFDAHSSTAGSWYSDNGSDGVYTHGTDTPGVVELQWTNEATYSLWAGIVFGSGSFTATYVKIEAYRGGAWQTLCEITNNTDQVILRQVGSNSGTGAATTRLKYTLGGSVNNSYFRIHSLYMANYRAGDNNLNNTSTDSTRGVNFLERYKNNYAHGHFYPGAHNTYDIGSSSYKWKNIIGVNLHGDLVGTIHSSTTANTQSQGNNSTKVATTAYVDTAVSNLVDSAPSTLDTLNELAAALGDDANFSTTVTNSIAGKVSKSGDTMTGGLTIGSAGSGHDVKFFGDLSGEYFMWDENVSTVNIYHRDELPGLEVYVNAGGQTTQPQLKVGRSNTQYWGAYVDDRNAHLVHRQDETSGIMTTRFDQWDSNTSDNTGQWQWRSGNGTGGSMTTAAVLYQDGDFTVKGDLMPITDGGGSLGVGSGTNLRWSGLELQSGAGIQWQNGDARIIEGLVNNYSLSFQTYDGSTGSTALRLDGDNTATFAGKIIAGGDPGLLVTGSGTSTIHVASTGTGIAGIYMDASNGDFIGSDYVFIGQDNDKTFRLESFNSSGDILLKESSTDTLRLSGGNATFAGNLTIPEYIYHSGNTDAHIRFQNNRVGIYADFGTAGYIDLHDNGNVYIGASNSTAVTISSSSATFAGTVKAATSFIADAVSTSNNDPGTDNVQVSGYGMIGNRGNLYITNANTASTANVQIGVGGVHNGSPKLVINPGSSIFYTDIKASADSTHDIGTSATRFANVYADTYYGDGSNLTGISGGIDGSGAANRLAIWSDSDTLTSDVNIVSNGGQLELGNGLLVEDNDTTVITAKAYEPHIVWQKTRGSNGDDFFKIKAENDAMAVDFTTARDGGSDTRVLRIDNNNNFVFSTNGSYTQLHSSFMSVYGRLTSSSDIRATQYYDYNDTTRYIDLNSTATSIRANGTVHASNSNMSSYQLNGTYVMDSSRNLVNIGTIGSGAITATGNVTADAFYDRNNTAYFLNPAGDSTLYNAAGTFFRARFQASTNLTTGWYTIAANSGSRSQGRFRLTDRASSRHQAVEFLAAHHYGNNDSNTITVLDNGTYSTDVFRYIRIKEAGTYDGAVIQVYIDNSTNNCRVILEDQAWTDSGWTLKNFVADATDPGDVGNYSALTEQVRVDLDDIKYNGGITSTGKAHFNRNIESENEIRGVSFKDYDNTAYYLDPSSTGTSLNVAGAGTFAGNIHVGANYIGRDGDNYIGFVTDNLIKFRVNGATQVKLSDGLFAPQTDSDVDLGTNSVRFKDLYVDEIDGGNSKLVTSDASNYFRINTSGGSAQLGLFRTTSGTIGGGYIGIDVNKFRIYNDSFSEKFSVGISTGDVNTKGHIILPGSKYLEFSAMGKLINMDVSTWTSGQQEHNILYSGWTSSTGDYLSIKVPGNSASAHGNLIIGDNGLWFGRANVTDNAAATDSNTNPHPGSGSNYFRVSSAGLLQVSGSVVSPIYYDTSGTTHYLDLSNTGTSLNVAGAVHWDLSAGQYSGDPRAVVSGYSGGNYGQLGYNIAFTGTSGTHNRVFNDIPTRIDLHNGIVVYASSAGAAGTSISWTEVLEAQTDAFQYKGQDIYHTGNNSSILNSNISLPTDFVSAANGGTFSGDIQATGIYVGSSNTSYDFYNNGTSYLNGAVTVDDNLSVTSGVATITQAATNLLTLTNTSNGSGAGIVFNDNNAGTQRIYLRGYHADGSSQGGGASLHLQSTENDLVFVVGDSSNTGRIAVQSPHSTAEVDYGFYSDINTGVYSPAAGQVGLVSDSSRKLLVSSNGVTINNGSLYIPEYLYHADDTDTYMRFTNNTITFRAAGNDLFQVYRYPDTGGSGVTVGAFANNGLVAPNLGGANMIRKGTDVAVSGVREEVTWADGTRKVQAHASTGNGNSSSCYNWYSSENVKVDPEKDYEFSVWIKSTGDDHLYLGWHEYRADGTKISANPYFHTSKIKTHANTNNVSTVKPNIEGWVLLKYQLKSHRTTSGQSDTEGTDRYASNGNPYQTSGATGVMHSTTTHVHLRLGTCYGSVSGSKSYFYNPKITEAQNDDIDYIHKTVETCAKEKISVPQGKKILFDGRSGHTYINEESDSNLKFYVGGTERMNVSGGNTYVQQKLHVAGNINIGDNELINDTATVFYNRTSPEIDYYDYSKLVLGDSKVELHSPGEYIFSGDDPYIYFKKPSAGAFLNGNENVMKVGLIPSFGPGMEAVDTTSGSGGLNTQLHFVIQKGGSQYEAIKIDGKGDDTSKAQVYVKDNMSVAGKLGIGTTDPKNALSVSGVSSLNGEVLITQNKALIKRNCFFKTGGVRLQKSTSTNDELNMRYEGQNSNSFVIEQYVSGSKKGQIKFNGGSNALQLSATRLDIGSTSSGTTYLNSSTTNVAANTKVVFLDGRDTGDGLHFKHTGTGKTVQMGMFGNFGDSDRGSFKITQGVNEANMEGNVRFEILDNGKVKLGALSSTVVSSGLTGAPELSAYSVFNSTDPTCLLYHNYGNSQSSSSTSAESLRIQHKSLDANTGYQALITFRASPFATGAANAIRGKISGRSTGVAYYTSSDARLKEDPKDFDGLNLIEQLKPYDFKWIDLPEEDRPEWYEELGRDYGLYAQEAKDVVPNAVDGDGSSDEMMQMDYSKLVPVLIKAVQQLSEKVKDLESKL